MGITRVGIALAMALAWTGPAAGQLRPLELAEWQVFAGRSYALQIGAGGFGGQRASLAGTEGTLLELGNFQATWRSGRIAVEASGTVYRLLEDESRFASAFGGALDEHGPNRGDSGDYRLATSVLVTPLDWVRAAGIVRFGARLPTTNNRVGLDRDQTDFFGVVGARFESSGVVLTSETGIGIYGTRYPNFEQSDLWIYAATAELPAGWITPTASILGQMDLSPGAQLRGNEDLTEVRAGARIGRERWVEGEIVHGLAAFSPDLGFLVTVGMTH